MGQGDRPVSHERLIAELARVFAVHGRLSGNIIRSESKYRPGLYIRRFGTLVQAYGLVGYHPTRLQSAAAARYLRRPLRDQPFTLPDAELLERLQELYARSGRLTASLIDQDPRLPSHTTCRKRLGDMWTLCRIVGATPSQRQVHAYRSNWQRARRSTIGANLE